MGRGGVMGCEDVRGCEGMWDVKGCEGSGGVCDGCCVIILVTDTHQVKGSPAVYIQQLGQ